MRPTAQPRHPSRKPAQENKLLDACGTSGTFAALGRSVDNEKRKMTRPLLILIVVSFLAGCGGSGEEPGKKQNDVDYYPFEEIRTGLRGAGKNPRYLYVTFTFVIDGAKKGEAFKAINENKRAIRDGMILFLSGEPIDKLNEKQTLDRIRAEIRKIANGHLGEPFVRRVLLDKLAVQ